MEAKDTILWIPQGASPHQTELCRRCAFRHAQAEASFKAGMKKVVEWLESICGETLEGYAYINKEIWQAKLKDWGLDENRTAEDNQETG